MFSQHGAFSIERRNNILFIRISGAWNRETALAYCKAARQASLPLINQPYATLSDLNDWELATPDCDELFKHLFQQAVDHGLRREAFVNKSGSVKVEQLNRLMPYGQEHVREMFEDTKSALGWLKGEGFTPD